MIPSQQIKKVLHPPPHPHSLTADFHGHRTPDPLRIAFPGSIVQVKTVQSLDAQL